MANYKQMFLDYMDSEGIKYTQISETGVRVTYTGDNMKSIPVIVSFDKDGDPYVQFSCYEIANVKGKEMAAIEVCNQLHNEYRWIKFYVDSDKDVVSQCDAYIDEYTCGAECLSLVRRVVSITDDAYPLFMRALYA